MSANSDCPLKLGYPTADISGLLSCEMRIPRRDMPVSRVMIDCPETGKPVYTHLSFEWDSFETVRIGERVIKCPECGKIHSWRRRDAYLDEDGGG
jgi:endogenous inhibitor of DNA gyrase (YacG/DUF329 family)